MKHRWLIAAAALVLFVVSAGVIFLVRQAQGETLERYKAELRARGEKLTFKEHFTGPTNATDLSDFIAAGQRLLEQPFSKLEIQLLHFDEPGVMRPAVASPLRMVKGNTTNETSWQSVAEALKAAEPDLEIVRTLCRIEPTHLDGNYDDPSNLPRIPFVEKRTSAHWLGLSSLHHTHSGNTAEALSELQNLFALARMHSADPTLVNHMIRTAIASLALHYTWECLHGSSNWTETQLSELQSAVETIDFVNILVAGMEGERVFGHEILHAIDSSKPPAQETIRMSLIRRYLSRDRLFYLKEMQSRIELVRSLKRGTDPNTVLDSLKMREIETKRIYDSWRRYTHLLSLLAIVNISRGTETSIQNEGLRRLTLAAIAIKRHELRVGKPPASLAELVPQFLAQVPTDIMDGKPLKYRVNGNGAFLLYSVGKNGVDDGGNPHPAEGSNFENLWDGMDAVWPGIDETSAPKSSQ